MDCPSKRLRAALCYGVMLVASAPPSAAQDRVRWYETRGIVEDRDALAEAARQSYWSGKLAAQAKLTLFNGGPSAGRDRDAILAAASTWLSSANPQEPVERVLIVEAQPPNPQGPAARVAFVPSGSTPTLEVEPLLVDDSILVQAQDAGATSWRPSVAFMQARFPGGIDAYCDSNVDICAALFKRLEQLIDHPGNLLVTVARRQEHVTFHASIQDSPDPGKRLTVRYLAGSAPIPIAPPADFAEKDSIDTQLERFQTQQKDPLGKLLGFGKLSRDERLAVKQAAMVYYMSGTRNAEADVALQIGDHPLRSLFAIKMLPVGNDVTVEKLGRQDLTRCDLRRSPGFPAEGSAEQTREWLEGRYPAVEASGSTSEELIESVQQAIDAEAGNPKWFSENYRMAVLGPTRANQRLADVHKIPAERRGGLKRFTGDELHVLECVIEAMGDRLLQRVRDTVLIRQEAYAEPSPFGERASEVTIAGHTFTNTQTFEDEPGRREVHSTVVIYDAAVPPSTRFVGGRWSDGRVFTYAPLAEVFAHEFGHVVASRASLEQQFWKWVDELKVEPFTRYAASAPQGEFFPEAFALFLLDPSWMEENYPTLFARAKAYASRPPLHW